MLSLVFSSDDCSTKVKTSIPLSKVRLRALHRFAALVWCSWFGALSFFCKNMVFNYCHEKRKSRIEFTLNQLVRFYIELVRDIVFVILCHVMVFCQMSNM